MSKGKKVPMPGAPGIRPHKVGPQKVERAFDQWLDRGLHELYDEVVREPVPPELLKLIEEDRKK